MADTVIKNTSVAALYDAGGDAQSNLFYADFNMSSSSATTLGANGGTAVNVANSMTVRLEGFTPPEMKQDTYTNFFGTAWVDVPKAFIDITRTFSLKFRVDNEYILYKSLCGLQKLNMDPTTAKVGNNLESFDVEIKVPVDPFSGTKALATSDFVTIYKFHKCWIKKLSTPEFKTGDSGVITAEATIGFIDIQDAHDSSIFTKTGGV